MSQPDSNLDDDAGAPDMAAPARGVIVKKAPTTVYTVMLVMATLAMTIGCILLALEKARYL